MQLRTFQLVLNVTASILYVISGILVVFVGVGVVKDLSQDQKILLPPWGDYVVAGLSLLLLAFGNLHAAWLITSNLNWMELDDESPKPRGEEDLIRNKICCVDAHLLPLFFLVKGKYKRTLHDEEKKKVPKVLMIREMSFYAKPRSICGIFEKGGGGGGNLPKNGFLLLSESK